MSVEFTYEPPDNTRYLKAIIAILEHNKESQIASLLKGCKCEIISSSQYSHKRWDAVYTEVHFYVPLSMLELFTDSIKQKIIKACDTAMPKVAGYDVMNIEISPLLDDLPIEESLTDDLEKISAELTINFAQIFPKDIMYKGKGMAEVYLYLYFIENSLRLFIENEAKKQFGDDWSTKLTINRSIRENIEKRKDLQKRNQWISIRDKSDLFFVDFKDLGSIIASNWSLFKQYFPDLKWIESKIDELVQCRNLVAHNSDLGDHEKNVIKLYYRSILKQIGLIK